MRIKKTSETTPFGGAVVNVQNDSTTDTYSCDFINENKEIYSTDEQVIGKWIDGKPIYRKVVELGNLPNTSSVQINHNISNIDKIIRIYGYAQEVGNIWFLPLPNAGAANSTQTNSVTLSASKNVVYVVTGTNRSGWEGYAVLEYTKTTD